MKLTLILLMVFIGLTWAAAVPGTALEGVERTNLKFIRPVTGVALTPGVTVLDNSTSLELDTNPEEVIDTNTFITSYGVLFINRDFNPSNGYWTIQGDNGWCYNFNVATDNAVNSLYVYQGAFCEFFENNNCKNDQRVLISLGYDEFPRLSLYDMGDKISSFVCFGGITVP